MPIRVHPPVHPGEVLREEFMAPLGLTGYALGKALGVPRTRIERLAAEQTPITPDTAIRLGRYFGTSADFWMNLQTAFDLTSLEEAGRGKFEAIQPRNAAA
jgi:addiction module HigA family antidote